MKIIIIAAALLILSANAFSTDSLFIYSGGERYYAPVDTTRLMISWQNADDSSSFDGVLSAFPNLDADSYVRNRLGNFYLHDLKGDYNFVTLINLLKLDTNIIRVNRVLKINERSSLFIGNEIDCKFKPDIQRSYIDSISAEYFVDVVRESEYVANSFVMRLTESCPYSTIEIANIFYELKETDWSYPNAVGNCWASGYVVQDIYYTEDQWNVARAVDHVNNSNHGAWEITRGAVNVLIAVLDGGMEAHTDFDTSLWDAGYDFVELDFDPSPITPEPDSVSDDHGMQVLGLIAARHNNFVPQPGQPLNKTTDFYSVAGVSPDCRILPVRMIRENGVGVEPDKVKTAIFLAKNVGADIINCSWGYDGPYPDGVRDAIDSALFNGRNGKGCIVIASVGNNPIGSVHPPASQDSVISVGAISKIDLRFLYNSTGSATDLLAPSSGSGKFTVLDSANRFSDVDREDSYGANPKIYGTCFQNNDEDYSCTAGGTSAAAPLVSGVVGLLLSINNNLTRDEVQEILRTSAVKVLNGDTLDASDIPRYGYGRLSGVRALSSIMRGDMDGSLGFNFLDQIYLVDYLFRGGPPPFPDMHFGDADCDGSVRVLDLTYLIDYFYRGGPLPISPCYEFQPGF